MEKILCATLTDLFEVCKITESLADLVEEGNYICTGSRSGKETKGGRGKSGQRKKKETGGGKGGATSKRAGVRKRNPTPRGGTKYPNSTEGPQDIVVPKVSVPRFVKRIASRKITKFAKDNNLTGILPKDGTIKAILNGQWNGQGIAPGSTIEANGGTGTGTTGTGTTGTGTTGTGTTGTGTTGTGTTGTGTTGTGTTGTGTTGTGTTGTGTTGTTGTVERRRGRRQVFDGERMFANSGGCLFRDKREAGEIKFNLRSLLSTFRSLQSGNLSGGLLQPLMVS